MTLYAIPWQHDRTDQLQVEVDLPMPELEQRIRTVAALATTPSGLRVMLGHMLGADYVITVRDTLGGVVKSVRLTRRR